MARRERTSMDSNSSTTSTSPERELEDDDNDSIMQHQNDSQSSLNVSLEDMEIDNLEYERQQRLCPISRLPAELLITIFSKLSSPHDFLRCMLVCKAWARNSVDLLWHRPSTNQWDNLVNVIQTTIKKDGYFPYHDLVKRLNLGQLKDDVSDGTLQPLAVCKRIERLTLPGCSQLTDASLVPVIDGNRSLMAIDVSDLELITDRSMNIVAKNCYRLQGLNISNCKSITDESLVEVAKNCRRLKRLKLNDCNQLSDLSIFAFADNCHDMLEIDLFRCANVTDQAITALIKEGKQLRELRLAQCFRITDEAFLQLPTEHSYEALRILDLTDCNELQDAGLMKVVQAAPRLRNLVLAKCRHITDRGVSAITKLGKNLHFLHLGHCANITDVGVIQLVRHCNRIRYIDFSCCTKLTDDSVQLLATLPKLKRIGLVKCANITDLSLQALARPKPSSTGSCCHPNNLERLHLSYCTLLSIHGIRTLLLSCHHLTHLSLTGVQPFLREDILRFCREAPHEFNEHQRDMFCVFSGTKVEELRQYLKREFAPSTPSNASFEDDSPSSTFVGPSSAPAIGRFPGLNRFNDPFDWAAPPPPAVWGTNHHVPPPAPPPAPPQRYDAAFGTFNPALPPGPPLPNHHGPFIQPRRVSPNTNSMQAPLAQSAPSQGGAFPLIPPPHSAGPSRNPFSFSRVHDGSPRPESSTGAQVTPRPPEPPRTSTTPSNPQEPQEYGQAPMSGLTHDLAQRAVPSPSILNQHPQHHHHIPASSQRHQHVRLADVPPSTHGPLPPPPPPGRDETPMAFPPTPLDDDHGGIDL